MIESLSVRLGIAAGLVLLNACFVIAEYSLVRVRASRIELLVRKGNARASRVQEMLRNLELYFSANQLGITMTSLGLGWIGEPAVAALLDRLFDAPSLGLTTGVAHAISFGVAFALITLFHIVLGELIPRSIALRRPDFWAMNAALPLSAFTKVFKYPITFMAALAKRIENLFGLPELAEGEAVASEEELRIMLGATETEGRSQLERLMLFENVFDFGSAKVTEAMVPRDKVEYLSLAKSWPENAAVIRERRLSRYPLCETDLDSVLGYVYLKDIALASLDGKAPDLRALRRDALTTTSSEPLPKLMKTFRERGVHIAVVRDGVGAVLGLVTLEDILEELIGEIYDEYDRPQAWSLMDVVVPQAVEVAQDAVEREALIARLVDKLHAAHPGFDAAEAARSVWERESTFSSAIGHGVAIPHARIAKIDRAFIAVSRQAKPVPFPAPDKTPVRLVFLILTPAGQPLLQLKILARIASLISNDNVRRRLLRAKTPESLLETLRAADAVLAAP